MCRSHLAGERCLFSLPVRQLLLHTYTCDFYFALDLNKTTRATKALRTQMTVILKLFNYSVPEPLRFVQSWCRGSASRFPDPGVVAVECFLAETAHGDEVPCVCPSCPPPIP